MRSDRTRESWIDELRSESEARWDDLREQRVLVALRARRERPAPLEADRRRAVLGIAAAIAIAAVVAWFAGSGDPSSSEPPRLTLADGSRVELGAAAEVQIEVEESSLVRLRQTAGVATYQVARRRERDFEVRTPALVVRVRGTVFDVEVDGRATEVRVREGVVEVDDGEGRAVLRAGEAVRIASAVNPSTLRESSRSRSPDPSPDPFPSPDPSPSSSSPSESESESEPDSDPESRTGTGTGTGSESDPESESESGSESEFDSDPDPSQRSGSRSSVDAPPSLFERADVARRAGRYDEAIALLGQVRAPRRALASFTIGRIEMERGRSSDAAAAFERAIASEPRGALAEDATMFAARAWQAAGNADRARARAADYLARWPSGSYAPTMRRVRP